MLHELASSEASTLFDNVCHQVTDAYAAHVVDRKQCFLCHRVQSRRGAPTKVLP